MKKIIIISDGTGKTAKRLLDAVLSQYVHHQVDVRVENIFQQVRDKKRAEKILEHLDCHVLVLFSIVSKDLREYIQTILREKGNMYLNVLEPMLEIMTGFLGLHPECKPGLLQVIDDKYYHKIDSIGFSVEHDDGRGFHLENADVILLGLSRTCKTPISMYLACNYGVKTANIPIVAEDSMKAFVRDRLEGMDRDNILGLIMDPYVLAGVRAERSRSLESYAVPKKDLHSYHNPGQVREEIKFSLKFFDELKIRYIDVTRRAIEEIARDILTNYLHLKAES